MATSRAWLLGLSDNARAAVGEGELIHIMERPLLHEIPGAPIYCRQVLIWQRRVLPVMDVGARLSDRAGDRRVKLAGIVAYRQQPTRAPVFGALSLSTLPQRISVGDDQACDLPGSPAGWAALSISCFSNGKGAIPILDLDRIFANPSLDGPNH
jgi:chemotaxis signal transduction protein